MRIKKKIKQKIKSTIPKQNSKVSLFIVGAQKAGTSALHNYLVKHPNVKGGLRKEINFFNHQEKYDQGQNWYHQQFKAPLFFQPKSIFIDSTPQYLNNLDVPEKIFKYNKNAKIVILLREPVSWAYSAWNMYKQFAEKDQEYKLWRAKRAISIYEREKFIKFLNHRPFPNFETLVNQEVDEGYLNNYYPHIIQRGIYVEQVKLYIELFGAENVLIFESNYFKNNKTVVTNKVLESLGLNSLDIEPDNLKPVHLRQYESPIDKITAQKLKEFYKPYNEELFSLINQKFNW